MPFQMEEAKVHPLSLFTYQFASITYAIYLASNYIGYKQHFKYNGWIDREKENAEETDDSGVTDDAEVKDDPDAPQKGFLLKAECDKIVTSLILKFGDTKNWANLIYLGTYDKGEHKLIPKIIFKLIVIDSVQKEQISFEFPYNNASSQTISYHSQDSWTSK